MKYTKPATRNSVVLLNFLDSLPAEFEIVEPGMTQVRWPDGVTRSELDGWCDDLTRYVPENADIMRYLRQRDELRGRLRVMTNIMGDALSVLNTIQGEESDEETRLDSLRAKMAGAIDSVLRTEKASIYKEKT